MLNKTTLKYTEITGEIIRHAMEVHKTLGNGYQEVIYQRALQFEFMAAGLDFNREFVMTIHYKGIELGTRRVDFLVEKIIAVELKAVISMEAVHLAQALNYLECHNLEVGLLINFGNPRLEFHRLQNKKFNPA